MESSFKFCGRSAHELATSVLRLGIALGGQASITAHGTRKGAGLGNGRLCLNLLWCVAFATTRPVKKIGVRTARAETRKTRDLYRVTSVNIHLDRSYAVGSGLVLIALRLGTGLFGGPVIAVI